MREFAVYRVLYVGGGGTETSVGTGTGVGASGDTRPGDGGTETEGARPCVMNSGCHEEEGGGKNWRGSQARGAGLWLLSLGLERSDVVEELYSYTFLEDQTVLENRGTMSCRLGNHFSSLSKF